MEAVKWLLFGHSCFFDNMSHECTMNSLSIAWPIAG